MTGASADDDGRGGATPEHPASRRLPEGWPAHLDPALFYSFNMVLDDRGRFALNGVPVENRRVIELFHRSLVLGPDGFRLVVGQQNAPVTVMTTPRFILDMGPEAGAPTVRLLGNITATARADTLHADRAGRLRMVLTDGWAATLLPAAAAALAHELEARDDGAIVWRRTGLVVPQARPASINDPP